MDKNVKDITYFISFSIVDAIKKVYASELYKKLKVESTKTWHLGPVTLYQELEAELNQ